MKHLNSILVAALLIIGVGAANAQDENNPWAVGAGINAVDVFPTGVDDEGRFMAIMNGAATKGSMFDEYFNANDHWNILPSVSRVSVGRYIGSGFSFTAVGTINKIDKLGDLEIPDVTYYGVDGEIKYSFRDLLNGPGGWFDPSIGAGGGYTWVDDIGFGTANGIVNVRFWLGENFALDLQSTYKHAFEDTYGIQHFQHSAGFVFKFGGKDTDGDGIYDIDDECPETPGLPEFNGCPDTDGDGIPDPQDACPTVPGLASLNGCPDADGDGITDAEDACPNEAGPAANNGCPYEDRDGDGVLDKDDECPDVPGTVANNGCPEVTVEIINQLNEYSKTILFDYDKATIRQESYSALQSIADIMKEYPTANFHIEGHTDSRGSDSYNEKLSRERAASVMQYLTTINIPASRLTSEGYGETRPIATNNTAAGRQQNRRVEISLKK